MEKIINNNIDIITNSKKPVVIDFYADWCGPCKMMAPVFETLSDSRNDIMFVKVNIDENQDVARKFGVRSIPTLCLVNNNEIISIKIGALSLSALKDWIDSSI